MRFSLSIFRKKYIFAMAFAFLLAFCQQNERNEPDNGLSMPPDKLIQENFSQADLVLSLKPDSLKIVKTIYADNGTPGYVIVEMAGKAIECYRGEVPAADLVRYQFLAEYEENLLLHWQSKKSLLVFLKKEEKSGEWRAMEFGQFELTPALLSKIKSLRKK